MPVIGILAAYCIGSVPFALLARAPMGRDRSAAGRERQSWRRERVAGVRGDGRRAGGGPRYREGRCERRPGEPPEPRPGDSDHSGRGGAGGHRRPYLSRVAAVSRRQRRGDRVRRVFGADAAGGSAGARDFRGHCLADEIHLARIGGGLGRAAADCLRHWQFGSRRGCGRGCGVAHRVSPPGQSQPHARGH